MKTPLILALLIFIASVTIVILRRPSQPEKAIVPTQTPLVQKPIKPLYTEGKPSHDGIGKFYLGREIAQVMGHRGINWLERDTRENEESPTRAIEALINSLPESAIIADIGAGSGYYTFRIAKKLLKGQVIAVDIQPEMLEFLEKREKELGLSNVKSHLGKIDSIELPPGSIDAALFVDAYHEFSHPYEMMQSIVTALRPGGRVYLLEYRAEDPNVPIKPLHKMTEAQSIKEMKAVGLTHHSTQNFLPWQHFMIFEKKPTPSP